jgi:hypothetical protein
MKSMHVILVLTVGLALLPTSSLAGSVGDSLDAAREALDSARESSQDCHQAVAFDLEKVVRSLERLKAAYTHSRAQRAMKRLENARDVAHKECPARVVRRIREALESLESVQRRMPMPGIEVTVPMAEFGWDPIYYDGYVIYYSDEGLPFYYVDGVQVWIPAHERYYYVDYYHQHRDAYQTWYRQRGHQYQGYRHRDRPFFHHGKPVIQNRDHDLQPVLQPRDHGFNPVVEPRDHDRKPVLRPIDDDDDDNKNKKKKKHSH